LTVFYLKENQQRFRRKLKSRRTRAASTCGFYIEAPGFLLLKLAKLIAS